MTVTQLREILETLEAKDLGGFFVYLRHSWRLAKLKAVREDRGFTDHRTDKSTELHIVLEPEHDQ